MVPSFSVMVAHMVELRLFDRRGNMFYVQFVSTLSK